MKNKIIVTTGYMGTGSSAVTDLISEIQGFEKNNGSYEYVFMHCPDGVFDLEDKLLMGNNALRSDEAVRRFLKCMTDLYDKKNYWISGYKNKVSEDFLKYCKDFISDLNIMEFSDIYWYFQQNPDSGKMVIKSYLRRIIRKLSFHRINIENPLRYKGMSVAFPSDTEFYSAAKIFLNKIFSALGYEKHNLLLDQLLLPHNLYRINRYFDDSVRVIVVDRDPRDIFILNKYFWRKEGVGVPYPTNAEDFCEIYIKIRQSEKKTDDRRILRIRFEDLVYRYDEMLPILFSFLDITDSKKHFRKKECFNPDISICNTQLFKREEFNNDEIKTIENRLGDYLYPFPNTDLPITGKSGIF